MKDFIVFAGPNGSGKSSVRDAIANPVEVIIDPDRIARSINPSDPRSVDAQAGRAAVQLFDDSLAAGKSISMETTLTGHSAVQRMQRAKDAGYDVSLIYVALHDPELNVFALRREPAGAGTLSIRTRYESAWRQAWPTCRVRLPSPTRPSCWTTLAKSIGALWKCGGADVGYLPV